MLFSDMPQLPQNHSGKCLVCPTTLPNQLTGRPRKTCSGRCRQILYRHNRQLRSLQRDFFERNPSAAGPQGIAPDEYVS